MNNIEFYKDKLLEIADAGTVIAIVGGKPINCNNDVVCKECDRHNDCPDKGLITYCTDKGLIKWLLSEYVEETAN